MSIGNDTIMIKAIGSSIPMLKANNYAYKWKEMVEVSVYDLPEKSSIRISRVCDKCGDEKLIIRAKLGDLEGEHLCEYCSRSLSGEDCPAYKGGLPKCVDCDNRVTKAEYIRCRDCSDILRGGSNHYKWIEDRTKLHKRSGSQMEKWGNAVKLRDSNKCVLCSADDKPLEAHHLVGFSTDKSVGYDVSNGVCLCNECHRDFHIEFGYGYNTAEQFEEYIINIEKDK